MKAFIITVSILLAGYLVYRTYRIATQDDGLEKMLSQNTVILDVRTAWEFDRGHIKGAVNIPLSHLHTGTIPLDTGAVIITCCSHGLRSVKAESLLKGRGYRHVYNGGAWNDLEGLVEKCRKQR